MLKKRYALTFALACLSLAACKKDESEPTPPPTDGKVYFSGLTKTDLFGTYMNIDVTDWRVDDDHWTEMERGLLGVVTMEKANPTFNYEIKPYPNPCDTVCRIQFTKPATAKMDVRIVDEKLNIIYSQNDITANVVKLDSAFLSTIRDTVRMYYRITEESNAKLYGHGDILVKENINKQ